MKDLVEEKARARLVRDCRQIGAIYDEPGSVWVDETSRTVELSNVRGTLARYRYSVSKLGRVTLTSCE